MKVGVIGLGKMGGPIAKKLQTADCQLMVYDIDPAVVQEYANEGFVVAKNITELSAHSEVMWVMVPQKYLDEVLDQLCACTAVGTALIDGGNSFYKDSIRRAKELEQRKLEFLDCGTSGGLWGAEHGFSMTIGGKKEVFKKAEYVFKLLATGPNSYGYVGPSGAGHYVKMIHNGIEYALLEAYAEGFNILRNGAYTDLDLAAISKIWLSGGVIRSWLLQLTHEVLVKDQRLESIKGTVGQTGTGKWTVEEAERLNIPVPIIKGSVDVRNWSQETGGDFRTKLIALVRHAMGGHAVALEHCEACGKVE
jgi:6-phosphogluconate dehydrogenase